MIILTGVAGSGKSTQGRLLADKYGFAWVSTGELLRVLVTGKRRQEMLKGELLSDDEMTIILDKVLDLIDTTQQFVLDGFPRTLPQADWLLAQVDHGRFDIDVAFNLVAPEAVVQKRLKQRGRTDDTDESITLRLNEYRSVTLPILALFKSYGVRVEDINAGSTTQEVHHAIDARLVSLNMVSLEHTKA